jgi:hypothetical protein
VLTTSQVLAFEVGFQKTIRSPHTRLQSLYPKTLHPPSYQAGVRRGQRLREMGNAFLPCTQGTGSVGSLPNALLKEGVKVKILSLPPFLPPSPLPPPCFPLSLSRSSKACIQFSRPFANFLHLP